jgi:pilus assembly protein CpaD
MVENAMTTAIAHRAILSLAPAAAKLVGALLAVLALAGCKTTEEPGAYIADTTIIDPSERHPIMVSQQPATINIRVARGSQGLTAGQREQVADFLEHYRSTGMANGRLVIAVPSGSPNESAAMHAVGDIRQLTADLGFSDTAIAMEPYRAGHDGGAPIRLAYLRFVAEGPACGAWPTNLAADYRNEHYQNFGCAQQRNLAAQIVNPADLLGPRSMTPSDQERRAVVFDKYQKGEPTTSQKSADQDSSTKNTN